MIYGSVKSIGIDPKGMEDIPSKYLTSGRGWQSSSIVVHLGENILTYLTIQPKSIDFGQNIADFQFLLTILTQITPKMQNLGQSDL